MDKLTRKESSIPVQGRISIVDLAKMDRYWMVKEGISIKSMSQLLSWTFTAMCDVIESNGKMPEGIENVSDANNYLSMRGLYQQSMKKKGQSRLTAAMGFENLREQGLEPAVYSKTAYDTIHSKHNVEPFNEEVSVEGQQSNPTNDEVQEMIRRAKESKKEISKFKEEELNNARNSNMVTANEDGGVILKEGISDEELSEYNKKRDDERVKLERKPINVKDFDLVEET